ncbi:MAG TPA: class I SAM-dependent rRNA methyltransferase [Candidatus Polarisedimenticolia bacterium]|nr:class I SAM-dependent rRNA methyltransferase [Candidatus Polarisedimenticolia bacterium]
MGAVVLARGRDQRIKSGHLWAYASEIASVDEGVAAGDVVEVRDFRRRLLGRATYNPASTLALRVLTRHAEEKVDRAFFAARLEDALAYREQVFPGETTLRLIFSEGDRLPGLVVDRYDRYLCVQFGTLGMERWRETILEVLSERLAPAGIYERSDLSSRTHEGLSPTAGVLRGSVPDEIAVRLDGLDLKVRPAEGQKTGLFLDQRLNRREIQPLAAGRRVLDAFCNTGGFGLYALKAGAAHVEGVDVSAECIRQARRHVALNGFEERARYEEGNAFDLLHDLDRRKERFDIVVLDPPAFTKSARSVPQAIRGYKEINLRALRILAPGGFLLTSSCSFHLGAEEFLSILRDAAADSERSVRLVAQRGQSPDHPVLPGVPETRYLKFAVLRAS